MPSNSRASKRNEIVWWLSYDNSNGIFKERDYLDKPFISNEQFSEFISLLEDVVGPLNM